MKSLLRFHFFDPSGLVLDLRKEAQHSQAASESSPYGPS